MAPTTGSSLVPEGRLINVIGRRDLDVDDGNSRSVQEVKDIASFNWMSSSHAGPVPRAPRLRTRADLRSEAARARAAVVPVKMKLPGGPPVWTPPPSARGNISLARSLSSGGHNPPGYPLDQAVRALFVSEKTFQSESIDIFTTDQTLVKLINFVQGKAETLNIQAQLFGNTLFLVDKDKPMMNMNYSRSLLGAFTTWPWVLQNSIYHHRLVQYEFNGLQCLVRFEADGCLSIKDRLMAAALLSDILGSREATDLSSRDLHMKVMKSEQDESSFSQELVSKFKPTPPASETWAQKYHWSQLEAVAADAERKKDAMGAHDKASTGPSGKLHPPTSDSAKYIRFLAAYPVDRFRNITKASQAIAQQYLEMTDHDFEKAVALYFDTQTPDIDLSEGGVALPDAAPSKTDLYAKSRAPLIARLAKAINVSTNTAEVYLDQCGNDFQRSVRLHQSKMRQLKKNNGKVDLDDEAKIAIAFQEREQQRYVKRGRSSAFTSKAEDDDEPMNVNLADPSLSKKPASYIHHSYLFAARIVPDPANNDISTELALRLWSTRIPNIITATHDPNGTVTSICYTDIRPFIHDWEVKNRNILTRTSELLNVIKHTLGKSRGIVELRMSEDGDMECWEIDTNKEVLSAGMKEVWLGLKSLADVPNDEVDDYGFFFNDNHDEDDDDGTDSDESDTDEDDDSDDENDQARQASIQPSRLGQNTQDANILLAGLDPQILRQAQQQAVHQQQQQQDYVSDESSEWEKEYSEEEC